MLIILIITKYFILFSTAAYLARILYVTVKNMPGLFSFTRRKELSVVLWVFIFTFLTLLGYQSYWQLFIDNEYFAETKKIA